MQKRSEPERAMLESEAAEIISNKIAELLKSQEQVVLAVPGGRSVAGIFHKLVEWNIDWKKVHIFMVDERMVQIDHKDSNFLLAKENFLQMLIDSGKLPEENVHPFLVDKGIDSYAKKLQQHGGIYDIILLSSGEDGHIGALYPNHHSVKDDSDYFLTMEDSPKPPPNRMTLSRNLLLKAKLGIILFLGEGKREALEKFEADEDDYVSCPARLLYRLPTAYYLTDLL